MNTEEESVLLRSLEATQRRLNVAEKIFQNMMESPSSHVWQWETEILRFMQSKESGSEPSKPAR